MDWRMDAWGVLMRVSPFRHLRISGYLLLPAAFRSLSRLSSALSAKASSLRSLQLNLQNSLAILVWSVLHSVALQTWLFLNCFVFPLMLLNGLGCLLFWWSECYFLSSSYLVVWDLSISHKLDIDTWDYFQCSVFKVPFDWWFISHPRSEAFWAWITGKYQRI